MYLLHMWVPVATVLSMALCLRGPLDAAGMQVLGLGVFVVYTGDRLLEHGGHWGAMRDVLWVATGIACGAIAYRVLTAPPLWSATAALGVLSLSYLALKRLAALKTLLVGLTWAVGCAVLAHAPQPGWAALGRPDAIALLFAVCAGAVLCDLKDADRDRDGGVRSLPVLLGSGGAVGAAGGLALVGTLVAIAANAPAVAACNLAMLAVSPWRKLLTRPLLGPLVVDLALALPGLHALLPSG